MTAAATVRVPVLMYHEIAEASRTSSRLAVSPADFAAQLGYLRGAGFTTLTAGECARMLAEGGGKLPDRPVVLTFDDGYRDFHSKAMPLLRDYGCTATVFVTTGWAQDDDMRLAADGRMLSVSQIADAAAGGVEIGAHTRRHPQLDRLPRRLVREELRSSKRWLEDNLAAPVTGLAYPFGYSSASVREAARAAGYEYACAVGNRMASPAADVFALPRLTIRRATTMPAFRRLVNGGTTMRMLEDRALTRGWAAVRRARATAGF